LVSQQDNFSGDYSGNYSGDYRRFNFWVPITKARQGSDGAWVISGPLSEPGEDLQGETMDMAGLREGLEVYQTLGRNVDWEHLYRATKNPKYLIGKGIDVYDAPHPKTGKSVPWMNTKLFKNKEIAREAIKHLQAIEEEGEAGTVGLGYSVEGGAIQKSGTHIVKPIITMVTVTPQPVVSSNAGTISRVVKGLADWERGDGDEECPELVTVPETVCPISDEAFERDLLAVMKAMTASGTLPHAGPGAGAAEGEDLGGRDRGPATGAGDGKRKGKPDGPKAGICPDCDRPLDDCRCQMIRKAFAYQLSEELAELLWA